MLSKSEMESLAARVVAAARAYLLRDVSYGNMPAVERDRAQEAFRWIERRLAFEAGGKSLFHEFVSNPSSEDLRSDLEKPIVKILGKNDQDVYFLQHLTRDPRGDYDVGEVIANVGGALSGANTKVGAFGKD